MSGYNQVANIPGMQQTELSVDVGPDGQHPNTLSFHPDPQDNETPKVPEDSRIPEEEPAFLDSGADAVMVMGG